MLEFIRNEETSSKKYLTSRSSRPLSFNPSFPARHVHLASRRELDDAVLVLEEKGAPPITSGPGRSSAAVGAGVSSGSGGPAADMYERLVKAVLGRDKDASARPGAQETAERLLRVLQAQAQNLKVRRVDAEGSCRAYADVLREFLCAGFWL